MNKDKNLIVANSIMCNKKSGQSDSDPAALIFIIGIYYLRPSAKPA